MHFPTHKLFLLTATLTSLSFTYTILQQNCAVANSFHDEHQEIDSNSTPIKSNKISDIEVKGAYIWPLPNVIAISGLKIGKSYDAESLDKALKKLYDTKHYEQIEIKNNGGKIIINLQESPIMNQVVVEGNSELMSKTILDNIKSKPLGVYNHGDVVEDTKKILSFYKARGYIATTVTPQIIKNSKSRVDLIFVVDENPKTKITSIQFIGSKAFSPSDLRDVIISREKAWYILSSVDLLDEDRLELDKMLLKQHYTSNGYMDFKITDVVSEVNHNKKGAIVSFIIEEGKQYRFGNVSFKNEIKNFNSKIIEEKINIFKKKNQKKSKNFFNDLEIEELKSAIQNEIENKGYAFVTINRLTHKNGDVIDTEFVIFNHSPSYINRINIEGNVRTMDKVIRRQFRIAEGDPFNRDLLEYSKNRVEGMDFFKEVKFEIKPSFDRNSINDELNNSEDNNYKQKDKVDINFEVEEKGTGTAGINMAYSVKNGFIFGISTIERNIVGTGKEVSIDFQYGPRNRVLGFGINDPYFMEKNLSLGFDISTAKYRNFVGGVKEKNINPNDNKFKSDIDRKNYTIDKNTFGLNAGYYLNDRLSHNISYSLSLEKIEKLDLSLSQFIQQQPKKTSSSIIGNSLTYNALDNIANPKSGYKVTVGLNASGIGGNNKYIKSTFNASYYLPIDKEKNFVFSLSAKGGFIRGYGGNAVRIDDAYMMGMYDICGFYVTGIGPRDKFTEDALGAKKYYSGRADLTFPLGLPKDVNIKGALFMEGGNAYGVDVPKKSVGLNKSMVHDESYIRASVGFGLNWESPLGKIGIDFGRVLRKKHYDQKDNPRVSFGYSM